MSRPEKKKTPRFPVIGPGGKRSEFFDPMDGIKETKPEEEKKGEKEKSD